MRGSKRGMSPEKAVEVFSGNDENKLKTLRIQKGYSQYDLSVASGTTKRSIQYYEQTNNVNNAKLETICNLCIALGCKIEDILEDDEVMKKFKLVK